jgi:predicted metalloendopeptidase
LLASEIIWNVIKGMITAMPKEFREAKSEFSRIVSGIETPTPRWRNCGDATNKNFEYATTLLYADRYLSEEARQRVSASSIAVHDRKIC